MGPYCNGYMRILDERVHTKGSWLRQGFLAWTTPSLDYIAGILRPWRSATTSECTTSRHPAAFPEHPSHNRLCIGFNEDKRAVYFL